MPTVEFMGKSFTVDEDGFIDSYEKWSQEWVQLVKKEEGIEALNKAILINPEYYEAYAHRGLFYYAMGEFEKAQKDVNVAIEDDAKNVELLKTKATISDALSDFENALKQIENQRFLTPGRFANRGRSGTGNRLELG